MKFFIVEPPPLPIYTNIRLRILFSNTPSLNTTTITTTECRLPDTESFGKWSEVLPIWQ